MISRGLGRGPRYARTVSLVLLCGVGLLSLGCVEYRGWTYRATPPADHPPVVPKSVAVPPLSDGRPPVGRNFGWLAIIPLSPGGWIERERPETELAENPDLFHWGNFHPEQDIAKALAQELDNRNLFQEAFFAQRESDSDLVLRGALSSTKHYHMVYSYGLGPACFPTFRPPFGAVCAWMLLWMLGFPSDHVTNELSLTLRLEDRRNGKILWKKSYTVKHDEGVAWLYYRPPGFWYDAMLKQLMPTILADLEQGLTGSATLSSPIDEKAKQPSRRN